MFITLLILHCFFFRDYSCLFKCTLKWSARAKDLKHWWHLKGFSPVCFLTCLVNSSALENVQVHNLQAKGRSPVWDLMWAFKCELLIYLLRQPKNKIAFLLHVDYIETCSFNYHSKGLKRRKRRALLPKKGLCIFSYQDLIFWPNVINTTNDDFLPQHFVFYVIFLFVK